MNNYFTLFIYCLYWFIYINSLKGEYLNLQKTSLNTEKDINATNIEKEDKKKDDDSFEDDDLDEMVYEDAQEYDKRSLCSFFKRAMSMKIVFLAPCSNISLFEPFCVKIVAFFLNIATYLVLTAILFDEPTSALDPEMIGEVLSVIRELADEGMTMVIVTHEMGFAREVADRVILMEAGAILADQDPETFITKQDNPRIQSFISKISK